MSTSTIMITMSASHPASHRAGPDSFAIALALAALCACTTPQQSQQSQQNQAQLQAFDRHLRR